MDGDEEGRDGVMRVMKSLEVMIWTIKMIIILIIVALTMLVIIIILLLWLK